MTKRPDGGKLRTPQGVLILCEIEGLRPSISICLEVKDGMNIRATRKGRAVVYEVLKGTLNGKVVAVGRLEIDTTDKDERKAAVKAFAASYEAQTQGTGS